MLPLSVRRFLIFLLWFLTTGIFLLYGQEKSRVNILHADKLIIDRLKDTRKLAGQVRLQHEDVFMQCDSALIYESTNIVEAYSNVFLNQGDTVFLYGDYIHYDGNSEKAVVVGNVRLVDNESVLTTNKLNFDLQNNTGYYLTGGVIKDDDNILKSREGFYFSESKTYHYRGNVVITTPEYVIHADTLHYNTATNTTRFFGPTEIKGDSLFIYCERGWYDLDKDISKFSMNARLETKEHTVLGDTLYYDKHRKYGYGLGHVELTDTVKNIILKGNTAYYWEDPERTVITDSALFIQVGETDSLYLHADTLRSFPDISGKYRILSAYYGVWIYRTDLQGYCDSLAYNFADSVIRMNGSPVLWTEGNQLSADYMELFTRNSRPDRIEMFTHSFIISRQDSLHFNQIKGKNMIGYFRDNALYKIDVKGNGQTIYYPEDNGELIGFNKAESSNITILVNNNQISRITLLNKPNGILDPPEKPRPAEQKLKGFRWREMLRPKSREDVFK
ncbi:MAG: organic solvent tolerance protein OstA [Chlorobi bacterium]|nr:organic solvent tolerance protein OstA [Chlorobiota bacterium]